MHRRMPDAPAANRSCEESLMGYGVDSHCHVLDRGAFPFSTDAAYRPPPHEAGTGAQLAAVLDAHELSHALLVTPTGGYVYDNRCMVAAIEASKGRFRGIARVRPDVDARVLEELAAAGVIGIRLDLITDGVGLMCHAALPRLFDHVRNLGWQIHVQCEGNQLHDCLGTLRAARIPLVFDHCGRPDPAGGIEQPGFAALLEMGREGHAVKLSGPFRYSRQPAPYPDAEPFVRALIESFTPARCVWGSDWPFLRMQSRMDYGPALACLARWFPDAADRRKALWDNPARLFGFASA